jgi:hypothetical protein
MKRNNNSIVLKRTLLIENITRIITNTITGTGIVNIIMTVIAKAVIVLEIPLNYEITSSPVITLTSQNHASFVRN